MPLTTYLGQVLNNSAKIPKHFSFNRILIDKNPKGDLELYALSKTSSTSHESDDRR